MNPNFLQLPETPKIPRSVSFNVDDTEEEFLSTDLDSPELEFLENSDLQVTPILHPITNEQSYIKHTLETLDGYFQSSPQRKLLHSRRPSVFQTVSIRHSHWGIRHIVLVGMLGVYAALGGLVFLGIEVGSERTRLIKDKEVMDGHNGVYNDWIWHDYMSHGFWKNCEFDITLEHVKRHVRCGLVTTVIYATIGIPLMLVVLSDVGNVLLGVFTRTYNRSRFFYLRLRVKWKVRKGIETEMITMKNYKAVPFPFYLTILVVFLYLMLSSIVIAFFDFQNGNFYGMTYANALYFSFISMSTIGFGDVMPTSLMYNPIIQFMFLFGLALISVINSTLYQSAENNFMRFVFRIEKMISGIRLRKKNYDTCGYNVFKNLSHNIQLLAIAVPMFDEHEEEKIENFLETKGAIKLPHALAILSESLAEMKPSLKAFRAMRSNSKLSERAFRLNRPAERKKRSMTVSAVPLSCHEREENGQDVESFRPRVPTVSALEVPFMPFAYLNKAFELCEDEKTGKPDGKKKKGKRQSVYDLSKIVLRPRTHSNIA
ncbi:hypothetical protein L596_022985 [Steinernema carpocapsae]|uniref:Potassium channel domain-containing protein n=1 Tax=Steinernema carpocapsae TaxID=34508 RepID=A0A4U5MC97_STECR|nr:hypothetical protein L596_022985 [Steinernema carpocapsae]